MEYGDRTSDQSESARTKYHQTLSVEISNRITLVPISNSPYTNNWQFFIDKISVSSTKKKQLFFTEIEMMPDTKNNGSGPDAVSMIKEEEELLATRKKEVIKLTITKSILF